MAFIETPRFPLEVSAWMVGGEEFMTSIGANQAGYETRNQVWAQPRRKYSITGAMRIVGNAAATKAFFMAAAGRANGFRIYDQFDNSVDVTSGVLGTTGVGAGVPVYQLFKNYNLTPLSTQNKISKPVVGTVVPYRGGTAIVAGTGAGQYALDTTTGLLTMVADGSSSVSSITPGTTTSVTLSSPISGLSATAGQNLLYLNGLTGAGAPLVNGIAHTITAVAGAVYTLATNTAGAPITAAGTGAKYPQSGETMTWAGSFDIPVRFDTDWLQIGLDTGGLLNWDSITLIELRL